MGSLGEEESILKVSVSLQNTNKAKVGKILRGHLFMTRLLTKRQSLENTEGKYLLPYLPWKELNLDSANLGWNNFSYN